MKANARTVANGVICAMALALLSACAQRAAPVVDRGIPAGTVPPPEAAASPSTAATTPPVRQARDGIYIVQRGDTLYSIAMTFGVDQRELARWNQIADGVSINVGQTLRVTPPAESVAVTPVAPSGTTEVRPLPPTGPTAGMPAPAPDAAPPVAPVPPVAVAPTPEVKPEIAKPEAAKPSAVQFQWPAPGKVIGTFDDPRNKGIDIAGSEGAPVMAAADGEVVYVGSAVRGYGNLVIVRHSDDFITAYAHNRKILVQEKQQVKRGQTIAEVGQTDTTSPRLHFEIRHQGKPVDPLKHLPAR